MKSRGEWHTRSTHLDGSIRSRNLFECQARRLDKRAHKAELDVVLLQDFILEPTTHLDERRHVDLVERRQRSGSILRLLEPLGDTETHARHLDASFASAAGHFGRVSGRGIGLFFALRKRFFFFLLWLWRWGLLRFRGWFIRLALLRNKVSISLLSYDIFQRTFGAGGSGSFLSACWSSGSEASDFSFGTSCDFGSSSGFSAGFSDDDAER